MKFTIFLMSLSRLYHNCNEIIAYRLINHVHTTSKLNIKNVMNHIYRRTFKSIMLKPSLFKKCLTNFL